MRELLVALTQTDAFLYSPPGNAMPKFHLSRRTVLRGAGGIAIALPWLEIMAPRAPRARPPLPRQALPRRLPAGRHRPRQITGRPAPRPLHAQPDPRAARAGQGQDAVVDGLDMKSAVGEQHQAGIIAWLTGTVQPEPAGSTTAWPVDRSGDRAALSAGKKKPASRWPCAGRPGKSHGLLPPINSPTSRPTRTFTPHPARAGSGRRSGRPVRRRARPQIDGGAGTKSILDFVDRRYAALANAGRGRRAEARAAPDQDPRDRGSAWSQQRALQRARLVDTSDYNPTTGLNSSDDGSHQGLRRPTPPSPRWASS